MPGRENVTRKETELEAAKRHLAELELEQRIAELKAQARKDIAEPIDDFMKDFPEPETKRPEKPSTKKSQGGQHVDLPWNNIQAQGTIWRPDLKVTSNGKPYFTASLSIYNGKKEDGTYYPRPSVFIKIWGDLAERADKDLPEKTDVTVYGRYAQDVYERDGKKQYFNYYLIDYYEIRSK